jgi:hypothetical protein
MEFQVMTSKIRACIFLKGVQCGAHLKILPRILTINVPVVYMGRGVLIWMRGNP